MGWKRQDFWEVLRDSKSGLNYSANGGSGEILNGLKLVVRKVGSLEVQDLDYFQVIIYRLLLQLSMDKWLGAI